MYFNIGIQFSLLFGSYSPQHSALLSFTLELKEILKEDLLNPHSLSVSERNLLHDLEQTG